MPEYATGCIGETPRKKRTFTAAHIEVVWNSLRERELMAPP
jgi:hypothetical protein